jgi:peptidyl-prolyl cis-trans isomerase B (cyclophilin B)
MMGNMLFWGLLFGYVYISFAPAAMADNAAPQAVIDTKFGSMEIRFFPEQAPKHVENFIKLAKSGFYNGTIFHRVIPGFMIQGGDPNTKDKVSMARSQDPNSAGSQFFIVVQDATFLDRKYTVFGEVVNGISVADKIVSQQRDGRDNPLDRIEMTVRIVEPPK